MLNRRMQPYAWVLLVLLTIGCGADRPISAFTAWDRAGVRIAYSTGAAWGAEPAWRLADEPLLQIGVVEGALEEQFARIASVFRLPDGRIVVTNLDHPPEIRIFDESGAHLVSMGRSGEGPGEFRAIGWVQQVGRDSLLAYDYWKSRLTYFDTGGELLGSVPLIKIAGEPANSFSLGGVFGDGSILARPNIMVPLGAEGQGRSPTPLMRFRPNVGALDTLAVIPDVEYYVATPGQPAGLVLFGLRSAVLAAGERLFVGTAEEFRIDSSSWMPPETCGCRSTGRPPRNRSAGVCSTPKAASSASCPHLVSSVSSRSKPTPYSGSGPTRSASSRSGSTS